MAIFNWFKKNKDKDKNLNENIEDESLLKEEQEEIIEELVEKDKEDVLEDNINDSQEIICEDITNEQEFIPEDIISEDKEDILKEIIENSPEEICEEEITSQEEIKEKEEPDIMPQEKQKKEGFFSKIKRGIAKTRDSILNGVESVLSNFTSIDEELFEELEESLIMSDIGVETSCFIIDKVRKIVKEEKIKEVSEVKQVIIRVITDILQEGTDEFELKSPSVLLIIGVNGVGKTTTIGKLTNNYKSQGKKVILGAADTFRAAAIDQLQVWGERNNVDVIKHQENSDPAAVVFDAVQASKARKADLLICDTAGRLHNKKNLMEELKKISRVIEREHPDAQVETLLVLDATTGQNALQQAKLFSEVANITGLVLTKLDGTAKGGIIIAIKNELKIPVRFIGVGEGIDDLRPFDAKEFSSALFE